MGGEAVIEMQLPGAIPVLPLAVRRSAQKPHSHYPAAGIIRPNANSFVAQASIFEQTAPGGMKKLAAAVERANHMNRGEW